MRAFFGPADRIPVNRAMFLSWAIFNEESQHSEAFTEEDDRISRG
jgi:hypothetical protein